MSKSNKKVIYFDNNATTQPCPATIKTVRYWLERCVNPSTNSKTSQEAKDMLDGARQYVLSHCGVDDDYHVLFTSGATESNCFMIKSMADGYRARTGRIPHFITSSIEHKSILECLDSLANLGQIRYTLINPNMYGQVDPILVAKAIIPDTCLISIMAANNELGTMNYIDKIAETAHGFGVPFHTDAVQMFGKYPIDMSKSGIDALSMSFHKLYGPQGVGMLLIRKQIVDSFNMIPQIHGSQQYGLRGGTENVAGIAGSIDGMKWCFANRDKKNRHLVELKNEFMNLIKNRYNVDDYYNWYNRSDPREIINAYNESAKLPLEYNPAYAEREYRVNNDESAIVFLGLSDKAPSMSLPNTIMLSIIKPSVPLFCNIKFKEEMDKKNSIIAISSACNTSSPKASHVITAIKGCIPIKKGVLRISFGDYNTIEEVREFFKVFSSILEDKVDNIKKKKSKK